MTRWIRTFSLPAALIAAFGCGDPDLDVADDFAAAQIEGDEREFEVSGADEEFRGNPATPRENAFVNPLSGKPYTTERNDGDGYYSALDWSEHNPGVGSHHCGEDWNGESGGNNDFGAPVYATSKGLVTRSRHYGSGWGNIVMIEHYIPSAGHPDYVYITSVYAHLDERLVSEGTEVARGQQIGTVGTADGKYPAHLHFEMRWDEDLEPTANAGYHCPNEQSGTFDPTDFIQSHPPGWN